jgi:hypothetical protein
MKCDVTPKYWDVEAGRAAGRTADTVKTNALVENTKSAIYRVYRELKERDSYVGPPKKSRMCSWALKPNSRPCWNCLIAISMSENADWHQSTQIYIWPVLYRPPYGGRFYSVQIQSARLPVFAGSVKNLDMKLQYLTGQKEVTVESVLNSLKIGRM